MDFDLSGRTAIVTGGGTGIGKAITLELARAGADVAIASRSLEHLEPVAAQLVEMGRRSLAVPMDVRDEEMVADMVAKVMEAFGHIDILVNNTGVSFEAGVEEMSLKAWKAVIDIDLNGTYLVSRHVGKEMITQKKGSIVNIASVAGLRAFPRQAHYGAAKAGIINFTRSLAAEWGQYNIRVNCVAPGPILTEMPLKLFQDHGVQDRDEIMRLWGKGCAIGRCGTPEEVAQPVVFLASDAAAFVSGATLVVDGCYELEPIGALARPAP
ncbi:MAG: glucose 1-dehydrogenase [Chloroflexota bacterium]